MPSGHATEHVDQFRDDVFRGSGCSPRSSSEARSRLCVTGIVEHAGQVGDVVFAGLARLDAGKVLVTAAKRAVDDGDAGLLEYKGSKAYLRKASETMPPQPSKRTCSVAASAWRANGVCTP